MSLHRNKLNASPAVDIFRGNASLLSKEEVGGRSGNGREKIRNAEGWDCSDNVWEIKHEGKRSPAG
jgi:hypothetical protein